MAMWNKNYYPIEKIRYWFSLGRSQSWVARELGVDMKLIYKIRKKHNLSCVVEQARKGSEHPMWKGGRLIDEDGYVLLYTPGHPHARKPRKMYVPEHRLVVENHLGRYLNPKEVVHHINRDKQDNRIENLELYPSNGKHLAQELKGNCPNWSKEGRLQILIAHRKWCDSRNALKLGGSKKRRKTVR